jgi:hypothetical protein
MKTLWLTPFILGALCSAQEPSVTLDEAVRLALARHEDIGKARAASDALKGKIREVKAQAYPDVQFLANAMRWRDPSLLNASGLDKFPVELRAALVPSPVNIFDYGISVKQPLFNTALFRLFPRDRKTDSVANTRRIGAIAGEPLCERPDQLAIGVEPQDLESGHPPLAKTLPVADQRSFLRRGTHLGFLRISSNISRL